MSQLQEKLKEPEQTQFLKLKELAKKMLSELDKKNNPLLKEEPYKHKLEILLIESRLEESEQQAGELELKVKQLEEQARELEALKRKVERLEVEINTTKQPSPSTTGSGIRRAFTTTERAK